MHNAIGNLFEIKDFALEAADIVIRDMYWEPSEFEYEGADGAMFPSIVLCFNNYGATFDAQPRRTTCSPTQARRRCRRRTEQPGPGAN